MTPNDDGPPSPPPADAHRLARLLRHEVGDLLQSIYSTTAVLLDRLASELSLERRLLVELKQRAEVCRFELDAALDLASPPALAPCRLDLVAAVAAVLSGLRGRFPAVRVAAELGVAAPVRADPRALYTALTMLVLSLGHNSKEEVRVRLTAGRSEVELHLSRGGYSVPPEQLAWLSEPFATTQQALFGLALAQAARVVRSGGGEVEVANPSEGGVCVRIVFPVHAAV